MRPRWLSPVQRSHDGPLIAQVPETKNPRDNSVLRRDLRDGVLTGRLLGEVELDLFAFLESC